MAQTLIDSSMFFINAKDVSEIILIKGDWITVNYLTPEFLDGVKNNKYKVVFLKEKNVFSHGMNVFRKVLFDTNTIAVVGVQNIFEALNKANKCNIIINKNLIAIEDETYKFRQFNFIQDTSEIIEYNMDTEEICYKPDYYYNNQLSCIIVNGYNLTSALLPFPHSSRCDNEGRIWSKGFNFPYLFFYYFSSHPDCYYSNLLEYIKVLEEIFAMRNLSRNTDELINALEKHYSYSIIFSFLTPNISEALKEELGGKGIEKVYNFFVMNSPIHNKENLTDISLAKMKTFLNNILIGIKNKENYCDVYHACDMPSQDIALMYFVTNMFSDIRRCVINIIIENNLWFRSIYLHRKQAKIY